MVRIVGAKAVSVRLAALSGTEKVQLVGEALFAGGEIIKTEARLSITTGAVSGKHHVASVAPAPPKNDEGILAAHINTIQTAPLRVEVESAAPHAVPLEKGWKIKKGNRVRSFADPKKQGPIKMEFGGSKVPARPYMGPATRKKRKEVVTLVKKAVTIATRRK
jgi:hypothetical protein